MEVKKELLACLHAAGLISPLDVHFAELLARLDGTHGIELTLAAALVSAYTGQGHICVDLRELGGWLLERAPELGPFPEARLWYEKLRRSEVVGLPGDYRPLILDEAGRLYTYRYWEYERKLAESLRARMDGPPVLPAGSDGIKEELDRLFPPCGDEVDWQKIAAFAGVLKTFCVISGGPGTGKTTTVARFLALLLGGENPGGRLRVALAAPTGKAAARLQEAIKSAKEKLHCPEPTRKCIPESASTIHRLLGVQRGTPYFRHNAENPLPVDVLVVDEASMVDLALMSKLLQALPRDARLVLLGDKDQLSSVEAGAVLGDICNTGERISFSRDFAADCASYCGCRLGDDLIHDGAARGSKDCIIELQKSYRFTGDSGIGLLSRAVRDRDADRAFAVLKSGRYAGLVWNELPASKLLWKAVKGEIIEGFKGYLREVEGLGFHAAGDPHERLGRVFELFEGFRILGALREGPFGIAALNALVENILEEAHLLSRDRKWYVGRPVLIRRNDYGLRLFNGDVGIYLPDMVTGGDFRVFFPGSEGRFRSFHPLRLPEHETVYAMTVHKSQGSEFDHVLMILPDRDTPVLNRELVYTGITRARRRVSLWGSEQVLRNAITRSAERLSGLSDALWR